MKEYLNADERIHHIVIMAMQGKVAEFIASEALLPDEKAELKKVLSSLTKFNMKLFKRFGLPYRRKIEKTLDANKLRLVGKYEKYIDCISHSATEDLMPKISELRMLNCMDCERTDHVDCAMYAMCVACDFDGEAEDGCPFRL